MVKSDTNFPKPLDIEKKGELDDSVFLFNLRIEEIFDNINKIPILIINRTTLET